MNVFYNPLYRRWTKWIKWPVCVDLKDIYHCYYKEPLTEEELDDYEALTFFTRTELKEIYDLFAFQTRTLEESPSTSYTLENHEMLIRTRTFYACPFTDRLIKIFSTDGVKFTFTDYVDMFNAFHWRTPLDYRMEVAFRIYDFDEDGVLSLEDIIEYLKRITHRFIFHRYNTEFEAYDYVYFAETIMFFFDFDRDGVIGFMDFKRMLDTDDDFNLKFNANMILQRGLNEEE